ncbi:MAG: hypothetical protein O7E52_05685 [Candidatus Poribacteria bacterium]|nr:hypothetical protein [Candidatus Poribacteria bacterium]
MIKLKMPSIAILTILALFVVLKFVLSSSISEPTRVKQSITQSEPIFPHRKRAFSASGKLADYRAIGENNLFRPLGWTKEVAKPAKPTPKIMPAPIAESPPPLPTYSLILTGIVQSNSEWIAVVEDQKLNKGVFLHHGERLQDTLVRDIFSQYITLARGETTVQLALGESIEYGTDGQILFDTLTTAKKPPVSEDASAEISSATSAGDADNQQSLIERMRARRRRELGQ